MTSKFKTLLHLTPLLVMVPAVHAADIKAGDNTVRVTSTAGASAVQIQSARATELIGHEIRNDQDQKVAKIDDFLVDLDNGRIVQVLISGEENAKSRYEVPPRTLGYSTSERVVRWRSETKVGTGPQFSPPGSNRPGDTVHAAEVYRYYGEEPYFTVNADGSVKDMPKSANNVHTHSKVDSAAAAPAPVSLGRVALASEIIGLNVKDGANNKVGAVEDLIIDIPAGRVVAVIISSGGFLGLGDSLSALPPSTVRYSDTEKNELRANVTKDTLTAAPRYKAGEAARFNDVTYTDEVYRAYSADLYSTVVGADNTRVNVRDRDHGTLTPIDQSNAPADLEITARIRKDIVARDDLSTNAKNVKIITRSGHVTLRGPVKTLGEKRVIEVIAAEAAGSAARVDNLLEVKEAKAD